LLSKDFPTYLKGIEIRRQALKKINGRPGAIHLSSNIIRFPISTQKRKIEKPAI